MGVNILGPATFAAQTQIAQREAGLRRERQIVAGFGAAQQILSLPPSERSRAVITTALELAGLGPVAALFGALTAGAGPKKTAPQFLLRDLIITGTIPPEKLRRLEELKLIDQRRLAVRLEEWLKEIVAPGTGQPAIATFGFLPQERGRLVPARESGFAALRRRARINPGAFGRFGRRLERRPILLADGTPLLELGSTSRKSFIRRLERTPLAPFRRKAAELRRLAQSRGAAL